jgi:hypothetical protein
MNLDNVGAFAELQTELVAISGQQASIYFHVIQGGDPMQGGAVGAQQSGDQYVMRCNKSEYLAPAVHDKLTTTNYGVLRVKQFFTEGDMLVVLATGNVRGMRV